ncbi:alpha-N-acetylgalactosaminide alpha-2,6-sialyltransferase 2 isoform X2 [Labeo rohita]|uniref:alpha-N-acetylgalactosaminide alpha-2,6-sialyltransferase 2 isoform X2 n=1 Tax=Labeo rohita TaxID=84645 RepID=UPI0021E31A50|nr:alpha-N-acetylgalactosaminide alpha-2,6-sialyltransferase 2 isoform X2 [Labeo rohita]
MTGRQPSRLLMWFIGLLGVALFMLFLAWVTMQFQVKLHGMSLYRFHSKHFRFFLRINNSRPSEHQQSAKNKTDSADERELKSENGTKSDQTKSITNPLKPVVKPTEPDFFGDRYAKDDVPSQTNCPSNIRKRVPQTQFAQMFLHSIPVLQWAKHFTPEEYERLSHYSGAHGWGSVGAEVLKSSLGILNTSANQLMFDDWERRANRSECIRCAVVGNGGILNGSRKGKEIDEHDYVFRVNGAVLKGFEKDVGSRTSFYTFSTNTMRNSMRSYAGVGYRGPPISKETRYIFLPDHDRDYILMKAASTHTVIETGPERSKNPPTYFGKNVTAEKFKIYHPDFIRYLRNRLSKEKFMLLFNSKLRTETT